MGRNPLGSFKWFFFNLRKARQSTMHNNFILFIGLEDVREQDEM